MILSYCDINEYIVKEEVKGIEEDGGRIGLVESRKIKMIIKYNIM